MFQFALMTMTVLVLVQGRPQQAGPPPPAAPAGPHVAAAPGPHAAGANVTLLKSDVVPLDDKGSYSYDVQLSDGTKFAQMGNTEAPAAGENETSIVIRGSYSYISPEGTPVNIMYIANKDGFQATGDAIPKDGNANATAPVAHSAAGASSVAPAAPASNAVPAAPVASSAPIAPAQPATPVAAAPATQLL